MSQPITRDFLRELLTEYEAVGARVRELAATSLGASRRLKKLLVSFYELRDELEAAEQWLDVSTGERVEAKMSFGAAVGAAFHEALRGALGEIGEAQSPAPESGEEKVAAVLPTSLFGVGEFLQFLAMTGRSGTLIAETELEVISLTFRDGHLVAARSSHNPADCRLGEILVRTGAIPRTELQALVRAQRPGERLGECLLRDGSLQLTDLRDALCQQARAMLRRVLVTEAREFRFERSGEEKPAFALDLNALLLEGVAELEHGLD